MPEGSEIGADEFREKYLGELRASTATPSGGGRTRGRSKVMNRTEAAYAAAMDARVAAGEIKAWFWESIAFSLVDRASGVRCTYTPDFGIINLDGSLEIHEVKGHMEEDARVKMLWFVQKFKLRLILVTRNKGGFNYKEFGR